MRVTIDVHDVTNVEMLQREVAEQVVKAVGRREQHLLWQIELLNSELRSLPMLKEDAERIVERFPLLK